MTSVGVSYHRLMWLHGLYSSLGVQLSSIVSQTVKDHAYEKAESFSTLKRPLLVSPRAPPAPSVSFYPKFDINFAAFDSDDQHRNLQRNRMELLCTDDKAMQIAMKAIPTTTSQPDEDHEADNEHLQDYKLDIVSSRGTLGPPLVLTA